MRAEHQVIEHLCPKCAKKSGQGGFSVLAIRHDDHVGVQVGIVHWGGVGCIDMHTYLNICLYFLYYSYVERITFFLAQA